MKLPILRGAVKRKLKLKMWEARFILDCVTLDWEQRRAAGFKRRRYGLLVELADMFGVSRRTIEDIAQRRRWRTLRLPHLYDISLKHRKMLSRTAQESH